MRVWLRWSARLLTSGYDRCVQRVRLRATCLQAIFLPTWCILPIRGCGSAQPVAVLLAQLLLNFQQRRQLLVLGKLALF